MCGIYVGYCGKFDKMSVDDGVILYFVWFGKVFGEFFLVDVLIVYDGGYIFFWSNDLMLVVIECMCFYEFGMC